MNCQQCGFSNKNQFLICPDCSTYQFKENTPISSMLISFILASIMFGLTYFFFVFQDGDSKFSEIIKSHWINSIILLTSYLGIFLVIGKFIEYVKQRKALSVFLDSNIMNLLASPKALTPGHYNKTIFDIRTELLEKGCKEITDYIVFDLVRKTLYHLDSVQQKESINETLNYHAEISRSKINESFTMLKVLYWAIPILGFIGTVMGIGVAIGAFSDFISTGTDSAGLKSSLVEVSKGLSVAFDSTLIALSFTVVLLPVGTLIENLFENLIIQIEEYTLSFITPNMSFPMDENSAVGILNKNVSTLSIQTSYMQEFLSEFTVLCRKLTNDNNLNINNDVADKTDTSITEEVVEDVNEAPERDGPNTDLYPTEELKVITEHDMKFTDNELTVGASTSDEKIILTDPVEESSDKEITEEGISVDDNPEMVAPPPIMNEFEDSNEATLLESLISEKDEGEETEDKNL
ncbi:MAG: hypothetical protein COA79_00660 [Planctomycetota bacterium]|nr:MAG: hypothetical protein COA79_00660 [Planctomycetota bacterium]